LVEKLINKGIAHYGAPRYVVQNNGLSDFWVSPQVMRAAGQVDTGYQMLWFVTDDSTYRMNHGIPIDPATELQTAADNGVAAGARFLEIYYADIVNPDLQDVIATAHDRLTIPGPGAAYPGAAASPAQAPRADTAGPPSRDAAPAGAPSGAEGALSDVGPVLPNGRSTDGPVGCSLEDTRELADGVPALFGGPFPASPGAAGGRDVLNGVGSSWVCPLVILAAGGLATPG
jgi:hypothetical protein